MKTINTDEFIEKSIQIHGDRYDYTNVNYINNRTNVIIICEDHGIYEQTPYRHLTTKGCRFCSGIYNKNTDEFIERSIQIHGDRYDYTNVNYINNKTDVEIICSEHGSFNQLPLNHIRGRGCGKCVNNILKTLDKFILEANQIHRNRYDYSESEYLGANKKLDIKCEVHGVFGQKPSNHLNGKGCPSCNFSKGEDVISIVLNLFNIKYETQKKFEECLSDRGYDLRFDFYLPKYNICIEYDGIQHFESVDFFGGEEKFKIRKRNDNIKNGYCSKSNISLMRIPYHYSDIKIEEEIKKIIKKNEKS